VAAAPLVYGSTAAAPSLDEKMKLYSSGQEEPLALSRDGAQCIKGFEATLKVRVFHVPQPYEKAQCNRLRAPCVLLCAFRETFRGGREGGGELGGGLECVLARVMQ